MVKEEIVSWNDSMKFIEKHEQISKLAVGLKNRLSDKNKKEEDFSLEKYTLKEGYAYISCVEEDSSVGERVCQVFEENKIKCWLKSRDLSIEGSDSEIFNAILDSLCFIFICSKYTIDSRFALKELDFAFSKGIPILCFKTDMSELSLEFGFILFDSQFINAHPRFEDKIPDLLKYSSKFFIESTKSVPQSPSHDVFISYSTKDAKVAQKICLVLEQNNIKCWIAPRNIAPGSNYIDQIDDAIDSSKLHLLVYSRNAQESPYVKKEVQTTFEKKPILAIKVDDSLPEGDMEFYLKAQNWIDAYPNLESAFETIVKDASRLLNKPIDNIKLENDSFVMHDENSSNHDELAENNHKSAENARNFKYLDDLIHSGAKEIILDSDIILDYSEESKYNRGIKLDVDNLVIDGNGHAIDANGKTRIFYCTGKNITIENIILKNGFSQYGGAIGNTGEGELTITSSMLQENTAEDDGGAIYNREGNFKIFSCEFSNNKSPNNIILNNDSLQIHNTIFKDNQSKFIVLNDGDEANLGILNGEFCKNNVEESVLCNTGKFCSVEKTVFQNNISNNTMNIINKSELTLNSPKIKDKGKSILNHKSILIRNSQPELENIIRGKGTIENIGERIPQGETFDFGYLDKKIHESKTKEIILEHDITFENYERDFYEGGIELDIDDLIINGNGHTIDGADKSRIFIITGKNITLKNITFKNGHSHKNYDNPLNNNGGTIKINHNNNITIENCEFINNTSAGSGGAIFNSSSLVITESTLQENTAQATEYRGGAIFNDDSLVITKSTLKENTAEEGGGAICYSGSLVITESTLKENTAEYCGAIFNGGSLVITESTLKENRAVVGGAIGNVGSLVITESTLTGNTAENDGGGAIYNHKGELTITDSTLKENRAGGGGAIYNYEGELTITGSTLTGNTAQITEYRGGAINLLQRIIGMRGRTSLYGGGGAIYLNRSKKYESENCTFKDNKPNDVDDWWSNILE